MRVRRRSTTPRGPRTGHRSPSLTSTSNRRHGPGTRGEWLPSLARIPSESVPLTPEAARRLVDAGLVDADAVAAASPGELKRLLRGSSVDPALVEGAARLVARGAGPVTVELLTRAGVTPASLESEGPGEAFDRLREAVEGHLERVPTDYRVDYAELGDLAVAASER